eukprot:6925835-Ditylum_brightwellii.AAC.1
MATASTATFVDYVNDQPEYVCQLLGTLKSAKVDAEYWILAINTGKVATAIDMSVVDTTGSYAAVLHTDKRK